MAKIILAILMALAVQAYTQEFENFNEGQVPSAEKSNFVPNYGEGSYKSPISPQYGAPNSFPEASYGPGRQNQGPNQFPGPSYGSGASYDSGPRYQRPNQFPGHYYGSGASYGLGRQNQGPNQFPGPYGPGASYDSGFQYQPSNQYPGYEGYPTYSSGRTPYPNYFNYGQGPFADSGKTHQFDLFDQSFAGGMNSDLADSLSTFKPLKGLAPRIPLPGFKFRHERTGEGNSVTTTTEHQWRGPKIQIP